MHRPEARQGRLWPVQGQRPGGSVGKKWNVGVRAILGTAPLPTSPSSPKQLISSKEKDESETKVVVRPKVDLFLSETAKSEDAARRRSDAAETAKLLKVLETGEAFRYLRQSPVDFAKEASSIRSALSRASCSAFGDGQVVSVRESARIQGYLKALRVRQARFDRELETLRRTARDALERISESGQTEERGLVAISTAAIIAGAEAARDLEDARKESARLEAEKARVEERLERARSVSMGLSANSAKQEELKLISEELQQVERKIADTRNYEIQRAAERTTAVKAELSEVARKHPALRDLVDRLSRDPDYFPDPSEAVDNRISRPARLLARKLVSELNRRKRESRALVRLSAPKDPDDERDALKELELLELEEERENAKTPWVAEKLRRKTSATEARKGSSGTSDDPGFSKGSFPGNVPTARDVGMRTELAAAQARAESLSKQLESVREIARNRERELESSLALAESKLAERDAEILRLKNAFEEEKRKAMEAREALTLDSNQRTKAAIEELRAEMTRALQDAERRAQESHSIGKREGFEEGRRKGLSQAAERERLFGGVERERHQAEIATQREAQAWAQEQLREALSQLEKAKASIDNAEKRVMEERNLRLEAERKLAPLQARVNSEESELSQLRLSLIQERERYAAEIERERRDRKIAEENVEKALSGQKTVAVQAELEAANAALSIALAESESLRDRLRLESSSKDSTSLQLEQLRAQLVASEAKLAQIQREAREREIELQKRLDDERLLAANATSGNATSFFDETRAADFDSRISAEKESLKREFEEERRRASLEANERLETERSKRSKLEADLLRERELRGEAEKSKASAESERDKAIAANAETAARARSTVMRERDAAVAKAREATERLARESEAFRERARILKEEAEELGRRETEAKERVRQLTEDLAKSRSVAQAEKAGRLEAERQSREIIKEAVKHLEDLTEEKARVEKLARDERRRSEKLGSDLEKTTKARDDLRERAKQLDDELKRSESITDNVEEIAMGLIRQAETRLKEREENVAEKERELARLKTQHSEALRQAQRNSQDQLQEREREAVERERTLRDELRQSRESLRDLQDQKRLGDLSSTELLHEANRAKEALQSQYDELIRKQQQGASETQQRLEKRVQELEEKLNASKRREENSDAIHTREFERLKSEKEQQLRELNERLTERQREVERLQKEVSDKKQLDAARQRQEDRNRQDSSNRAIEALSKELDSQKLALRDSESARRKLEDELNSLKSAPKSPSLKETVSTLRQKLEEEKRNAESIEERFRAERVNRESALQAEILELKTQLSKEREQEDNRLRNEKSQLETEIRELKSQLQSASQQVENFQSERLARSEEQLEGLRTKLLAAQTDLEKLRKTTKDAQDASLIKTRELEQKLASSTAELETLKKGTSSAANRLAQQLQTKQEKDALQQRVQNLESELAQKQQLLAEQETLQSALDRTNAELQNRKQREQEDARILAETREKLERVTQDAKLDRVELERALMEAKNLREAQQKSSLTESQLQSRISELEKKLTQLQVLPNPADVVDSVARTVRDWAQNNDWTKNWKVPAEAVENENLRKQVQNVVDGLVAVFSREEEIRKTQLQNLQRGLDEKAAALSTAQAAKNDEEARYHVLQTENQSLRERLETEKQTFLKTKEELAKEQDRLLKQIASLQKTTEKRKTIKRDYEELRKAKLQVDKQLSNLQKDNEALGKELEDLKKSRTDDIDRNNRDVATAKDSAVKEAIEALRVEYEQKLQRLRQEDLNKFQLEKQSLIESYDAKQRVKLEKALSKVNKLLSKPQVDKMEGVDSKESVDMLTQAIEELEENIQGRQYMAENMVNEDASKVLELQNERDSLIEQLRRSNAGIVQSTDENQRLQNALSLETQKRLEFEQYVNFWTEDIGEADTVIFERAILPNGTFGPVERQKTANEKAVDAHLLAILNQRSKNRDRRSLEESQKLKSDYEQNLRVLEEQLKIANRELTQERSQKTEVERSKQLEIDRLNQELQNAEQNLSQSRVTRESYDELVEKLKSSEEIRNNQAIQWKAEYERAKKLQDELSREVERNKTTISTREQALSESLNQEQQTIASLRAELEKVQASLKDQQQLVAEKLDAANRAYESERAKVGNLETQLQAERQKATQTLQQNDFYAKELEKLKTQVTSTAHEVGSEFANKLAAQIQDLYGIRIAPNVTYDQMLTLLREGKDVVRKTLAAKISQLYGYDASEDSFEELVDLIVEEKNRSNVEATTLKQQKEDLELKLASVSSTLNTRVQALQGDLAQRIEENTRLGNEKDILANQLQTQQKEFDRQEAIIRGWSSARAESEKKLNDQISDLKQQQSAAQERETLLQNENAQLQKLQEAVSQQQRQLQTQTANLQNAQTQLAAKEQLLLESTQKQASLQSEIAFSKNAGQQAYNANEATSREFNEVLNQLAGHLQFRDRAENESLSDYAAQALVGLDEWATNHEHMVDVLEELGKVSWQASLASESWIGASANLANLSPHDEQQLEAYLSGNQFLRDWWTAFKASKPWLTARMQTARPEEQVMRNVHAKVVDALDRLGYKESARKVANVRMSSDPNMLGPDYDVPQTIARQQRNKFPSSNQ